MAAAKVSQRQRTSHHHCCCWTTFLTWTAVSLVVNHLGCAAMSTPKLNAVQQTQWLPPSTNGMSPSMQTSVDGPAFNSAAAVAMVTNQFSANVMGDSAPGINPLASPHAADAAVNTVQQQAQAAMLADQIIKGQNPKFMTRSRATGAALEAQERKAATTAALSARLAENELQISQVGWWRRGWSSNKAMKCFGVAFNPAACESVSTCARTY